MDTVGMNVVPFPAAPAAPPSKSADPEFSPISLAPIPPVMGTDTDAARQFYRTGVSQLRMPPLPAAAKIAQGAQAASQIILGGGGSSSIDLQTNNVDNHVQSRLNLTGSGVSYGPGPGQVQIQTGTGDGLIHGNSIWDIDSAVVWFRDDFLSVSAGSTPGSIGSGAQLMVSEIPWWIAAAANMTPFTGAIPNLGGLLFPLTVTPEGSTGGANFLMPVSCALNSAAANSGWALFDSIGWQMTWVFSFQRSVAATLASSAPVFSTAQQSLYIGLGNMSLNGNVVATANPNRPPCFFGLRFDNDTTAPAISDTTMHFEAVCNVPASTRNNTQGNTFDTGIVPTEFTEYRLDLIYTVSGKLTYILSGNGSSVTATLNVPLAPTNPSDEFNAANGYGTVKTNGWTASWVNGSVVTIAGYTGAGAAFNGTHRIVNIGGSAGQFNIALAGSSGGGAIDASGTINGFPGVFPWFSFGNSKASSPTANRNGLLLDFAGFVWNPGVGGGTGTPNPLTARYF
jgi:hypothetical protein